MLFAGLLGLAALIDRDRSLGVPFLATIVGCAVLCLIAISKPRYSFVFDPLLILTATLVVSMSAADRSGGLAPALEGARAVVHLSRVGLDRLDHLRDVVQARAMTPHVDVFVGPQHDLVHTSLVLTGFCELAVSRRHFAAISIPEAARAIAG